MARVEDDILSTQASYYGSYSKVFDNPRYRKSWHFVHSNVAKGGKVLDVGCADGGFSGPLAREGYDCHGLEFVDEAIAASEAQGVKIARGSFLEPFPFGDDSFDVVFAGEVVEHTVNDGAFLREIHRVLRPGGYCIITTPNLVSLGNRLLMSMGRLPRFAYAEFHYRIYNAALISRKIADTGLSPLRLDSSYVLVSTFFAPRLGRLGERAGTLVPKLGEHLIVYAQKSLER